MADANKKCSELNPKSTPLSDTDLLYLAIAGLFSLKLPYGYLKTDLAQYFATLGVGDIINNSTGVAFVSGTYEGTIQPEALTGDHSYTLPDATGKVVLDAIANIFTQIQTFEKRAVFKPQGTAAGDGGGISLQELATNGTEKITIRAADSISTAYTITMPAAQGAAGTTLVNNGSGTLSWQSPGSILGPVGTAAGDGGRILLQELAVNGTDTVGWKAPDSIAASFLLTLPDALPATGRDNIMFFDTNGLGRFKKIPQGYFSAFASSFA